MGKGQDADSGITAKPYTDDPYKDNQMEVTEDNAMEKANKAAKEAKSGSGESSSGDY